MRDSKSNPYANATIFCLLLGFFTLFFAMLGGFHLPSRHTNLFFYFVAASLWAIGTVLSFKALRLLESSEVTILSSLRSLVTIVGSILILQETFSIQKSVGTVIILGSVLMISHLKHGFRFNRGVLFALGSTLFNGMAIVFDVINLRGYDPISYLAISNFLVAGILLVCYPRTFTLWKSFVEPSFLTKMLPLGILSAAQAILYYLALSKGHASQIAPINQSQVILTVLLAAIILGERDHLSRKIIAALCVMVGVLLLR